MLRLSQRIKVWFSDRELPVYGEMKADTEQVVTLAVGTKDGWKL